MPHRSGVGQFFAWDGGCIFIGRHDRATPVHAHQSIQLVVASEGQHLVCAGETEPWTAYSMAAIPSRQPHAINVTGADYGIVVFVEPETRDGRAITERYLKHGIAEVGDDKAREIARSVFECWLARRPEETVTRVRELVRAIAADDEPAAATDPRILSAIAYINERLSQSITLDEVAAHACLSPSRLRHLFSEQVGMGLRPYILWRRFLLVWDLLMKGQTLSSAAHAAGFADAAHLSRTSVRAFGFAPTGIQVTQEPPGADKGPDRSNSD
ncbi:MAG: helix-turn-helix domain-containing protein [Gemmatimonadaceae bacterium]